MIYLKELYETEKKHFHSQIRRELFFELAKKHYPDLFTPQSKIADIGCASGIFLELLAEKGFTDLSGIDPNQESISFIRNNIPKSSLKLYPEYIEHFAPKHKQEFDLVFLMDVLEHIEDENLFLKQLKPILKENGRLIISVPAYKWLWSDHDRICNHYRRYTTNSLKKLLIKENYKIEFISYYSTLLFPLIVLQKMISKIKKYKNHQSFLPHPLINKLFYQLYKMEIPLIKNFTMPYGSSIVCFAAKS